MTDDEHSFNHHHLDQPIEGFDDGRFGGRDQHPLLERALLIIAPDGSVEHTPHLHRAGDGRLRPAK